jgi:hypothetical protein
VFSFDPVHGDIPATTANAVMHAKGIGPQGPCEQEQSRESEE